uniref:Uncharacterized protein n=2 Tax=Erpetoichthys calabaricus TaxID=27687 RepID=A0A8C4T5F0_ERPCA
MIENNLFFFPEKMFVTVRFGEDQREIFNPNCRTVNFLHSLKERCGCEAEACVDLIDELGTLVNLSERENSSEYTNSFLKERHDYILIQVIRGESNENNRYESLLLNLGKHYPDVSDFLQKLSNPQKGADKRTSLSRRSRQVKESANSHQASKNKTLPGNKKNTGINYKN